MNLIQDIHDTVIYEHGQASKMFLNYLLEEDQRIKDEQDRDTNQQDDYDMIEVLNMEYMDNSEIASYQWCHDNPGWWKEL